MAFLDAGGVEHLWTKVKELLNGKVSTGRKINGKALTADITLSAADVSAIPAAQKGAAGGVAELDSGGKVPAAQLPSYVDDVVEGYLSSGKFYKESAHTTEIAGESGKIYIDITSGKTYRWSGTAYVVVSETLALGETASTAYRGDRGKTAYDHSLAAHAPANAEQNVQSDWAATDTGSDSYIKNKPTSMPANGGNAATVEAIPLRLMCRPAPSLRIRPTVHLREQQHQQLVGPVLYRHLQPVRSQNTCVQMVPGHHLQILLMAPLHRARTD